MADPQVILEISKGFFRRNNPMDTLVQSITEALDTVLNHQSRVRLMKYKFMLAQQQLQHMENHVQQNPYDVRGVKIDRAF